LKLSSGAPLRAGTFKVAEISFLTEIREFVLLRAAGIFPITVLGENLPRKVGGLFRRG